MAVTPEMLAVIEAQKAKQLAARARGLTPEQCLELVVEACREADELIALMSPEERDRYFTPEPIPSDTLAILEQLQRSSRAT